MQIQIRKLTLAATAAAFLFGSAVPAFAQTDASAPAAQDAKAAKSQARKAARQRKAEHKAARAKNNAELKKLEDAGYKPAANDPNIRRTCRTRRRKPPALVSSAVRRQATVRSAACHVRRGSAAHIENSIPGTDEGKRDPGACVICFAFLYVSAHALRTPTQSVPHARRGRISRHLQPILNARTASSFARAEATHVK